MTWWISISNNDEDNGFRCDEYQIDATQREVEGLAARINRTRNHSHATAYEKPPLITIDELRMMQDLAFESALEPFHSGSRAESRECWRCEDNTEKPKRATPVEVA